MRGKRLGTVLYLAGLVACSSAGHARSDVNPTLVGEMAEWRTYAWLPEPRTRDEALSARIHRALDARMAAGGFLLDSTAPDFRIGWHAELGRKLDVETITDAYGYGWRVWYGPDYGTFAAEYDAGTLVLDVVDARRNELAWRGVADGRLAARAFALPTQDDVDHAVDEIIDDFPVQPGRRLHGTSR